MNPPAVVADVEARFPRALTPHEQTMAGTLIMDAWADLQDAVADLEARLMATEPNPDDLRDKTVRVLAQAVGRVLRNPWGRKQESRSTDDAQRSWTVGDALTSGALFFTDDELDSLRSGDDETDPDPYAGKAFSVMPS